MRSRKLIAFATLVLSIPDGGRFEVQKIEIEVETAKQAMKKIAEILEEEISVKKKVYVERKLNPMIREWNHESKLQRMEGWKPEATTPPATISPRFRRPTWRRIRSFCVRKGYY